MNSPFARNIKTPLLRPPTFKRYPNYLLAEPYQELLSRLRLEKQGRVDYRRRDGG
jgi:hypothetical protein